MTATVLTAPHLAAMRRLQSLSPLDGPAAAAIERAADRSRRVERRAEAFREGQDVHGAFLLLEGWTARIRQLPDGRRQLVSFGLPGDLLGYCQFDGARASSTMAALTAVTICHLPDPALSPALTRAFAISRALDEAYLIAHVTRLGRLNAHERLIDFLLELYERLEPCGLAEAGRFLIPLTQEAIADALGLTPVHLNRTLQEARRNGELTWTGREVTLHDPNAAAVAVGHTRARVCAFPAPSGA